MFLKTVGLQTGLKDAERQFSGFSRAVGSNLKMGIGQAIGAGSLIAITKSVIDFGSSINDASDSLGMATDSYQKFLYAIKQSGGKDGDIGQIFKHLEQSRQEALNNPNGKQGAAFQRFGVNAQDLKGKDQVDLINQMGDAYQRSAKPQELFSASLEIMGKRALPMIAAMREGLRGLMDEAQKNGYVMSDETVTALDDMGDAVDRFKIKILSTFGTLLPKVLHGLMDLWTAITAKVSGAAAMYGAASVDDSRDFKMDKDTDLGNIAGHRLGRLTQAMTEGENSVLDPANASDIALQKAQAARREAKRKSRGVPEGGFAAEQTGKSGLPGFEKPQLNSLQQIGAYSGVDLLNKNMSDSVQIQKQIAQNTMTATERLTILAMRPDPTL